MQATLGTLDRYKAEQREQARDLIAESLHRKKAFAHVSKYAFTEQLDERVQHPKLINQGKSGFCGPAAILYALAKDSPLEYARFALDLFFRGRALVRGWVVDANCILDQEVPQGIGACDWVTMAGIRTNVGLGALTVINVRIQGCFPIEIEYCFRQLQYRTVLSESYSTILWKADETNLMKASRLWERGCHVVLCVNSKMFKDPTGTSLKPNHFCILKSRVNAAESVTCRVWQWGLDSKEPMDDRASIFVDLPKERFMRHYFGFVAASDRRLSPW